MAGSWTQNSATPLRNPGALDSQSVAESSLEIAGEKQEWEFTADSSDGSVPDQTLKLFGLATLIEIVPDGSTAPTDEFNVQLEDQDGNNIFGGDGATLSNSSKTVFTKKATNATWPYHFNGTYTLKVTGNSVNSAKAKIRFWMNKS